MIFRGSLIKFNAHDNAAYTFAMYIEQKITFIKKLNV